MADNTLPDFIQDIDAIFHHKAEWSKGAPPNYSTVNKIYFDERWNTPEKGSLEDIITNLIKNWENEMLYKANPSDWVTITPELFRLGVNGGPLKGVAEIGSLGANNVLIGDTEYYCASKVTDPSRADRIFRTALPKGFAWECLQVYSKPPKVAFKWRHWGYMEGDLECPGRNGEIKVKGHGKKVEMFGMSTVTLNEKYQIIEMEHFFRPDHLLEQMVEAPTA